ncbi:MAG: HDOD domain-containing protein [Candidatus Accumulibacter sp.]|jgi:EAL and modified HD-GYP domain-containing signal transduction protein|nr:HDOD domain-containing protein [Accumulibacter sp.]
MSDTDPQDVFLGRQPILDRQQQLFAYELLFRGAGAEKGKKGNFAGFLDGSPAAAVIVDTFTELALAEALGPYQGFIKVDEGLLFSERVKTLPAHAVVLEILDTVAQTPETIAHCEQLRQAGYILAAHLRPEALDIEGKPLLGIVEIIKLDVSGAEPERLRQILPVLKPLRKTLLAEKVESDARMRLCHDLGFDLFQGYYFARPKAIEGKRLQSSETALLRLLGLISQDADTAEIEAVFKQEPVLTISLLRLTNSAGSGLSTRITSLRHAITLLGRRQLLRWLQLLLYSGASSSAPAVNPLLQLAATRGRLMELLVDHTPEIKQQGRDLVDQAFMAGILSLMPTMLGAGASELLSQLPLAAPVVEALGERQGVLGGLLTLVEALEEEAPDKAAAALQILPGIDTACVNACLARALHWANNLAR